MQKFKYNPEILTCESYTYFYARKLKLKKLHELMSQFNKKEKICISL